jgi:hypothetical protein
MADFRIESGMRKQDPFHVFSRVYSLEPEEGSKFLMKYHFRWPQRVYNGPLRRHNALGIIQKVIKRERFQFISRHLASLGRPKLKSSSGFLVCGTLLLKFDPWLTGWTFGSNSFVGLHGSKASTSANGASLFGGPPKGRVSIDQSTDLFDARPDSIQPRLIKGWRYSLVAVSSPPYLPPKSYFFLKWGYKMAAKINSL